MRLRTIGLALTGAAVIGSGYFFLRPPALGPDANVSRIQRNAPKKYSWKGGESWIQGSMLYFTYKSAAIYAQHSIDIGNLNIDPKDILAYEPGEKKHGILITRAGFHYLGSAEDVYFASKQPKGKTRIIQMGKDVSGLRKEYGDFIKAKVVDRVAYILTEQGALITNRPESEDWQINRLLDGGHADPKDSEILIRGGRVAVRIGAHVFEQGPGNVYVLR